MTKGTPRVAVEDTIAYHLRMAQDASFASIRKRFGSPDVRPGHYTILSIIARRQGLTQGELSKAAFRDTSTLTTTLSELSRKGYVQRTRSDRDRRSYLISLTDAGHDYLKKLEVMADSHSAVLDAIVGEKDKQAFIDILKRIHTELADDLQA